MEGKVVLITGAKGGLGTFVTEQFLAAGANVVGVSRSIKDSDFPNPRFTAMAAELSDSEAARKLAAAAAQRFGHIDVLVHLMGGFRGGSPVSETDDTTFEMMLQTNFKAAFYVTRAVIPHMRNNGGGRIVAIGSRAAVEPGPGVGAYSASKAALVSLIRTIAAENKDAGITANVLLPGTIDTAANRSAIPNADTSKWVPPQRLAELILWLASDRADQVNGAAIPVYGRDV
jgi:NAD(P)-dependent dehydrogenase (short-subunit alcohol dehydrogenase family)